MMLSRRRFTLLASFASLFPARLSFSAAKSPLPDTAWKDLSLCVDAILPKATEMGVVEYIKNGFKNGLPAWKWRSWRNPGAQSSGYARYIPYYQKWIERLNALSQKSHQKTWSALSDAERTKVLMDIAAGANAQVGYRVAGMPKVEDISDSALFDLVRRHTLEGAFAEPTHGGNKEYAAWKAIGHVCHSNYPDRPESCKPHLFDEGPTG